MKSFLNNKVLSLAMLMLVLVSCEKEYTSIVEENKDLNGKAFIKYYNAVVGSARNYIYADNVPLNGASIAYTNVFPSLSPSYFSLDAGTRAMTIKDTLRTTTQAAMNFSAVVEGNAFYTLFAYDSLNAPKQKLIKDNILPITDTTARVRFANFPFSTAAMPNVDIYSIKRKQNIFTNISPTTVTEFIPIASALNDTLFVRPTGTVTNLTQLNGLVPTARRTYTVIFRGSYRVTSGTAARTLTSFLSL